jgi:hypothetical protein
MRRSWLVGAAVLLGLATGCSEDGGANAEDQRRVDVMVADPLLVTVPPGGSVTSAPEGETTDSDLAWAGGGGTNGASSVHEVTATQGDAGRFYAQALEDQGWTAVEAVCTPLAGGTGTVVTMGARRWYDDFEGRASVSVEPGDGDTSRVVLGITAPFHTETGSPPAEAAPSTACLDTLK